MPDQPDQADQPDATGPRDDDAERLRAHVPAERGVRRRAFSALLRGLLEGER